MLRPWVPGSRFSVSMILHKSYYMTTYQQKHGTRDFGIVFR
jgi:hypothetical protein